jgi:glycosyltransferase involved in cell wall biosynthesis
MRIGLDMHYTDSFAQGVRRVFENLVLEYAKVDESYEFFLYRKHALTRPLSISGKKLFPRPILTNSGKFNLLFGFPYYALKDRLNVFHSSYVAPPASPCPAVVTVHDILHEKMPEFFGLKHTAMLKAMVRLGTLTARKVITPSDYSKNEVMKRYGVAPEKIVVTPWGIDESFKVLPETSLKVALSKFDLKMPYILFVSRIAPIKNLKGLLIAFKTLQAKKMDINLVIVGSRDTVFAGEQSELLIAELTDSKSIRFTGEISDSDLVALYNGADIFVLPSFGEGFGFPVLEAMACGTPVLCSDTTSLPEVAGNGALFMDPHNQNDFNEKLEFLVLSDSQKQMLRSAGLEHVKKFSWETTARMTLQVYEEAMG